MYLAGSFLLFLSLLTVVGVLISDIALAYLDPRIRLSGGRPQMTLPTSATRLPHTVSDRPFDPDAIYKYTDAQKALFEAVRNLRLMWWKFRRHKPALISAIFLAIMYLSILISGIPGALQSGDQEFEPHLRAAAIDPSFPPGLFRRAVRLRLRLQAQYGEFEARIPAEHGEGAAAPILLAAATSTSSEGLVEMRFHFVCPAEKGTMFLLGTDRLSRDVLLAASSTERESR